ncbi:hypothetical protein FOPG_19987 [Fusarium oxysporum f. sp. conglutinans race 2 54008]|uniref:Uncharacterized protein n=1 Tax=Fusarium oxysporum f. sp. conglutinans race 2 54008 TaxID=1089457 RepID=X0GV05_FUSOX|nr:hypothetical protein FOPG_19987 [Fusarium oxysporum f. sp. conglutinans race 2 54008]
MLVGNCGVNVSYVLFSRSQLSLPVAIANLIAVRTASRLGVHLGPSDADFPRKRGGGERGVVDGGLSSLWCRKRIFL